jgi:hypothetical protein
MPGGGFPEKSGVAGKAAEQHPGAADPGGHNVGALGWLPVEIMPDTARASGPAPRLQKLAHEPFVLCGTGPGHA